MAQKVQVLLVDDFDGGSADETVTFALDGVNYEIDLAAGNAAKLREAVGAWIRHARKAGGRSAARSAAAPRARAPRASRGSGSSAQAIRDWAKASGRSVSERGRISADLKAAYDAAH